jgi:hypothetical protein
MEAQKMNPTPEKETDIEAFSLKLTTLTIAANREFMKCNELRDYLDANAELLEKTSNTRAHVVAQSLCNLIAGAGLTEGLRGFGSAAIIYREYKNVLAGLLEGDSSFMIRLLAERAAVCWLHV